MKISRICNDSKKILIAMLPLLFSATTAHGADWDLRIRATTVSQAVNSLYIGQKDGATDGFDGRYEVPAYVEGAISAYFPHGEWSQGASKYWSDIKAPGPRKSWAFTVWGQASSATILLSWDVSKIPGGYTFTLVDKSTNEPIDMRSQGAYSYANSGTRKFAVETEALAEGEYLQAPTSLDALAKNSSTVVLNWTDNSTGETSFRVERQALGGEWAEIALLNADAKTYDDYGVDFFNHRVYLYRVRTHNGIVYSAYSDIGSVSNENPVAIEIPDTSIPDTSIPDTSIPDTSIPDTSIPDTSTPDTSTPDTSTPDTSTPDTSTPDTSTPDTSTPDDNEDDILAAQDGESSNIGEQNNGASHIAGIATIIVTGDSSGGSNGSDKRRKKKTAEPAASAGKKSEVRDGDDEGAATVGKGSGSSASPAPAAIPSASGEYVDLASSTAHEAGPVESSDDMPAVRLDIKTKKGARFSYASDVNIIFDVTSGRDSSRLDYTATLYEGFGVKGESLDVAVVDLSKGYEPDSRLLKKDTIYTVVFKGNDGDVELEEAVHTFVVSKGTIAGDVDYNGVVDGYDLILMSVGFGKEGEQRLYNPYADLKRDGLIDRADFELLDGNFGAYRK